ncbi:MAG TPA: hypothetical protein VM686_13355 [Polyangiaceae bacterium]|nr:hypothetical protein [Polyangiaceae bacterium]
MNRHLFVFPLVLLFSAACSSEDSDSPDGGTTTDDSLHGGVVVTFAAPTDDQDGYATILGRFFDGATPNAIPLELDMEQDGCELLVPALPFCNTPCAPDVCTADDVCTPYPAPTSVGTLVIDGLGSQLMLQPASSMVVYQAPSLAFPPCEEGAAVSATGDGVALEAECIAPLELSGPDPIPVSSGEAVQVEWLPAAAAASSRIRIGLDISHHGGSKGEISCDVPDTGSFAIPEPLVTKLISLGLAGYPTISVNRVSAGTDASKPNASLVLTAGVERAVDTGVTSCQDDVECADGQSCLPERVCG